MVKKVENEKKKAKTIKIVLITLVTLSTVALLLELITVTYNEKICYNESVPVTKSYLESDVMKEKTIMVDFQKSITEVKRCNLWKKIIGWCEDTEVNC